MSIHDHFGLSEDDLGTFSPVLDPDDFRQGSPALLPSPLDTFVIQTGDPFTAAYEALRKPLEDALVHRGINTWMIDVLRRRPKHEPRLDPRIVVTITTDSDDREAWTLAINDIRELLVAAGWDDVWVEILHPRGFRTVYNSPVDSKATIVQDWPRIIARILPVLEQCGYDWRAVDVIKRGYSQREDHNPTTILITSPELCRRVWDGPMQAIRSICREEGYPDLVVEARKGQSYRYNSRYPTRAPSGADIGSGDGDVSGTLGGYIRLQWSDGSSQVYGLTCFHCVAPPDDRLARSGKNFGPEDLSPVSVAWAKDVPTIFTVYEPSPAKHKQEFDECTKLIREHAELLLQIQDEYKVSESIDSHAKYQDLRRQTANYQAAIECWLATMNALGTLPRRFGTFVAGSGLRVSTDTGCSLDWALIEVDPGRQGINEIPHHPNFIRLPSTDTIHYTNDLTSGLGVRKKGRRTGITEGFVNPIPSLVRFPNNLDDDRKSIVTNEWLILSPSSAESFAEQGDSGAFVVDYIGMLAGMVLGGADGGFVYATAIERVFEDVRARTGAVEVDLP
ncbi:MAG: hypothetical protein M1817_004128 [Caeruleum heppii]|nr:MAG: hypothetical protein M1817_004128 [Caeruleum heppii]